MPPRKTSIKQVQTFPQLVKYLRDELEWPIESANYDEISWEYDPEELGLKPNEAAKIDYIRQMRPLTDRQPFGIFFVKFSKGKLPVVALRRILSNLVVKRRASANRADRPAWEMNDLLFLSSWGEKELRQMNFAHFADNPVKKDLPTLKVLDWGKQRTGLHVKDVEQRLHENLSWPDDPTNQDEWRKTWRGAFTVQHRQVIKTSKELAEKLAVLAGDIRDRIREVLRIESDKGPVTKLMQAFRKGLLHDLDEDGFADMYAQTIAYGLLSARIENPSGRTADDLPATMPVTNPFLKDLMETFLEVGGRRKKEGGAGIDFDELGVSDVIELLDASDMEAVVRDFGDRKREEDPVIHFYENFLHQYDPEERKQRGVFYTPQPIVSFIARSVDELLRSEFELEDGLADISTWGEMAKQHKGLKIPEGTKKNQPFVQILDPATGTGTFPVEVIDIIYKTMTDKWKNQGKNDRAIDKLWNDYVPKHLLPRLYGYELLMAPYTIAHLKVGLKLYETGYNFESNERVRIYLTNALEPGKDDSGQFEFMVPALAHETSTVNKIKSNILFTVLIGNPPYSVSSWNKNSFIEELLEAYKETVRTEETQIQSLSNDYIKFLRFSEWNIEKSGHGVMGLITGHGYLSGTQPRDLRKHLSETFDHLLCLDLHGSVRRTSTADSNDEPVFQIQTGVAITIGTRPQHKVKPRGAKHGSITGPLSSKMSLLATNTANSLTVNENWRAPKAPNFYFYVSGDGHDAEREWETYFDIPSCFGTGNRRSDKEIYWATGCTSQQDELAMAFTYDELEAKMDDLARSRSFDDLRERYRLCTTNQWSYQDAKSFARKGEWKKFAKQITYRPFDRRWTVLHKNVLTILRNRVMSQLDTADMDNLALVVSRAVNDLTFAHCFIVNERVDRTFLSSKTSTNAYVFPMLYLRDDLLGTKPSSNFAQDYVSKVTAELDQTPSSQDLLFLFYSILHSRAYRNRYASLLKIDFPRIPLIRNVTLFRALIRLGESLAKVHLLEKTSREENRIEYIGERAQKVERPGWSNGTVWLDAKRTNARDFHNATENGTAGFAGVGEEVWRFHVGGYQVCQKWLKDRKGRILTGEDIKHYRKIVIALTETIRIMDEIDEVIDQHGSWPDAFFADPDEMRKVADDQDNYSP